MKIKSATGLLATLLLSLTPQLLTSFAQGTSAFTYQGQLHESGTNANGSYTMTFALFDSLSGTDITNQLGAPITLSPTLVNGLFTVNLDFGNVFNGNARWLDITVQSGTNAPEELSPRVQILPSPYALYANSAGALSNGGWSMGVGNYGPIQNGLLVFDNGSVVMAMSTNGSYAPSLSPIPKTQTFASNGTFVVPTGVHKIKVEMWGAGGGGGALGTETVNSATYYAGGGGGGAGAYATANLSVTPGDNYAVTIGGGGLAGGWSGGATTFGNLISAGGGAGGGTGTVNYPNFYPGNGGTGGMQTNSDIFFDSGIGQGGNANTAGQLGGNGGSAVHGGAGGWGNGGGASGKLPGGGGGGGGTAGTPNGGPGAAGLVIVYY